MAEELIQLPQALTLIEQAREMIAELELRLPASPSSNFRERLVGYIEGFEESTGEELRLKANALISFYEKYFGANDLIDKPESAPD